MTFGLDWFRSSESASGGKAAASKKPSSQNKATSGQGNRKAAESATDRYSAHAAAHYTSICGDIGVTENQLVDQAASIDETRRRRAKHEHALAVENHQLDQLERLRAMTQQKLTQLKKWRAEMEAEEKADKGEPYDGAVPANGKSAAPTVPMSSSAAATAEQLQPGTTAKSAMVILDDEEGNEDEESHFGGGLDVDDDDEEYFESVMLEASHRSAPDPLYPIAASQHLLPPQQPMPRKRRASKGSEAQGAMPPKRAKNRGSRYY